ncbi:MULTISPECIES: hypothetical protein [unclassified Priestia]|uniref:hypothetical protein n=1 Tax=unclassified Priestia TaxID=2800374 RepID=UPI00366E35F7
METYLVLNVTFEGTIPVIIYNTNGMMFSSEIISIFDVLRIHTNLNNVDTYIDLTHETVLRDFLIEE